MVFIDLYSRLRLPLAAPNTLEILRSLGVLYDIFPNYDSEPPISKAFAFRYADDDLDFIVDVRRHFITTSCLKLTPSVDYGGR